MLDILRHGVRALQAQRRFAGLVVAALALGIGANVSLFSVVNSLYLRPPAYHNLDELVEISVPPGRLSLEGLRRAASFAGVAAFGPRGFSVREGEGVRNVYGFQVAANLFRVLGVQAAVGRTLAPEDDRQPVVMLGYDYWRRFSGDPNILGRTLTIAGENYTVVGVAPPDFWLWVRDANLFVPAPPSDARIVARLKPGVTAAQAQAEAASIAEAVDPQPDAARSRRAIQVLPLTQAFRSQDGLTVLFLQAAVGMVLLITCANIGNLLLARAAARRKEFAIRAALGGGRAQLFGQLLSESALLAGAGGALGLLLARWTRDLLQANLPGNLSRALRGAEPLAIDHRVLLFTAAVSFVTVLLFGLVPAMRAVRFDLMPALRAAGRGSGGPRPVLGQALVAGEIALAVMLLIGAGLTLKSLVGIQNAYLGFSPERVLRGAVDLLPARYSTPEQRLAAAAEIVRRTAALPGVETVGLLAPQFFPYGGPRVRGAPLAIRGRPDVEARAEVYVANPAYFRAVRIPLLKGRLFTEADTAASTPVALISDVVARRYWGREDPLGHVVRLNADRPDSPWVTIVGVVGDVRNPVAPEVQPTVYRPYAQNPTAGFVLMVRTAGDPLALAAPLRAEVRAVDPTLPEVRTADLERAVRDYVSPQRFTTSVLGVFALLGLSLAALGVYGVMRCWVAARVPEIGIRMALGAQPRDTLRLVLGRSARAVLAGVALGSGGALALRRVLASQLHGVSPTDPAVFAAVVALLSAVALAAAWAPARWATKVDPVQALRYE